MSQRKAVLIYNGNAGQKQIDKTLGTVVPILAQSADELLIKPTKHQDDARQYCENLDSSVDHLYILGGDGTVHQCINSISKLDHRPAVGILREERATISPGRSASRKTFKRPLKRSRPDINR